MRIVSTLYRVSRQSSLKDIQSIKFAIVLGWLLDFLLKHVASGCWNRIRHKKKLKLPKKRHHMPTIPPHHTCIYMFENMMMFVNLHFNVSYHSLMVLLVILVLTMLLLVPFPCLPAAADATTSPPTDLFNSIKLLVSYFGVNKQSRTPDAILGVRFAKCKWNGIAVATIRLLIFSCVCMYLPIQ